MMGLADLLQGKDGQGGFQPMGFLQMLQGGGFKPMGFYQMMQGQDGQGQQPSAPQQPPAQAPISPNPFGGGMGGMAFPWLQRR